MSEIEHFYYHVPYHVDCEVCGKRIDGVIIRGVKKNDTEILGDTFNSFADSVDGMNASKFVEARVKAGEWDQLLMPYGPGGHACPNCGARQSWDPLVKIEEPEKKLAASSKAGSIGCSVFGITFGATVLGLIVYLIQGFVFYESDPFILMVIIAAGVVAGIAVGIWSNKKTDEELDETYDKRMREYQDYLKVIEAFEKEVAARASRNTPIVDFSQGLFYGQKLETPEELAKGYPNACPSCGKKLEGKVLVGSLNASRVEKGQCPWCGAVLPPSRRVRLTTE